MRISSSVSSPAFSVTVNKADELLKWSAESSNSTSLTPSTSLILSGIFDANSYDMFVIISENVSQVTNSLSIRSSPCFVSVDSGRYEAISFTTFTFGIDTAQNIKAIANIK